MTGRFVGLLFSIAVSGATQAYAANQIMLAGQVLRKCTLEAIPDPNASNVPLTAAGAQRIRVGTVAQDCNGRTGYTLEVLSTNCLDAPTGAKLKDADSGETLGYSVEANNPTTGGSQAVVLGLLAASCTDQVMRDVSHAIIHDEISTLYIRYTGSATLAAGTYRDTLTITMSAK